MNQGWIQTFTGKKFHPLAARAEDVDLRDIAHALALKCRFNGHCRAFYSVADHSLRVSRLLEQQSPPLALWGLMHDAAEAYLPDLGGPIKKSFHIHTGTRMETFDEAEDRLLAVIAQALRFSPIDYEAVREADYTLLVTEARDLLNATPHDWSMTQSPLPEPLLPLSWQEAEAAFLARYGSLTS
jgi:5'-deoxynucleotidase YfbR-like HD superfamily hydrolase